MSQTLEASYTAYWFTPTFKQEWFSVLQLCAYRAIEEIRSVLSIQTKS